MLTIGALSLTASAAAATSPPGSAGARRLLVSIPAATIDITGALSSRPYTVDVAHAEPDFAVSVTSRGTTVAVMTRVLVAHWRSDGRERPTVTIALSRSWSWSLDVTAETANQRLSLAGVTISAITDRTTTTQATVTLGAPASIVHARFSTGVGTFRICEGSGALDASLSSTRAGQLVVGDRRADGTRVSLSTWLGVPSSRDAVELDVRGSVLDATVGRRCD